LEGLMQQLYIIANDWKAEIKHASMYHFLQLILVYCNGLRLNQSAETTTTYPAVVASFTNLLERNFRNTHKVSYYTDHLNLTYNSLSRYTANYCSKTPKEIIVERVILEVKRLLSGTDLSIKEIAFQLGFDEPTNLIKYFKKYTGITPSMFRDQG
jgi:AraC family transcriptional regulator, transcriptional activator of pobA